MINFNSIPRIPLDGNIDLTYRCNNNCRHCWLQLPQNSKQKSRELTFEEIRLIIDSARQMGTQAWTISGGEPMIRGDFSEIFDYITRKSVTYTLNTNGTLITPKIARQMNPKGKKLIAIYGATAEVHDYITRTPGSFDAAMRGIAYLKEAGANFIVQIVPMKANFHQSEQMLELAQSLSEHYRYGASWLWLSANHSKTRNCEILKQRLDPAQVIALDKPNFANYFLPEEHFYEEKNSSISKKDLDHDDRLFAHCINSRRDFHIDPYGMMSFCYYIKDSSLRYDLRTGSFQEAWDDFIPSLEDKVHAEREYWENCGSCELREDCRWCPVFGYLEHGRYSAKVEYLCQVTQEFRRIKDNWRENHLRYFEIAGITIQLTTDFPITENTFDSKFENFVVDKPGKDIISIQLFSFLPELSQFSLGKLVHQRPPWAVYEQRDSWVYVGILDENNFNDIHKLAILTKDNNQAIVYTQERVIKNHKITSLTTFPSDLLFLSHVLADRQGCYFHASGMILNKKGFLFVGHSGAGKSTMMKLLKEYGEILCDERLIVRRWPEGFRVHGTWSHGELSYTSQSGALLRAILLLEKSDKNELIAIDNKRDRLGKLLSHVMRPIITKDWWIKTLDTVGRIASEVPAYTLKFVNSSSVIQVLEELYK